LKVAIILIYWDNKICSRIESKKFFKVFQSEKMFGLIRDFN
jgi:hypothetical protein